MSIPRTSDEHIRILRSRNEVETLRTFWASCHTHRDADLDFFLFVGDLFAEVLRPHVVVLYKKSQPIAILAGRLETSKVPIRIGYLTLPVPRMRVIQISGWLGKTEKNAEILAQSLFQSLEMGEADVACFRYIDNESALAIYAREAAPRLCAEFFTASHSHWFCARKNGDSFLASLSRNQRTQQRRRERKIARAFDSHRIERFCSAEEISRLIQDAEWVAKRSYQRRLNVGFSDSSIIRSRLEFDAAKGWLVGYILYFDEQPCAFWIGSLRNRVFLSNYLAFDPSYSEYSPGMYLVMKVMEALSSDASSYCADRIDFGVGDAIYKERLSNHNRREAVLCIFAPRIAPILVNALRSTMQFLNGVTKTLWTKLELRSRRRSALLFRRRSSSAPTR
jgi:Acetyltransferase (GNAT) domain